MAMAPSTSPFRSMSSASIRRISTPLASSTGASFRLCFHWGHHGTLPQQSMAASPFSPVLRKVTRGSPSFTTFPARSTSVPMAPMPLSSPPIQVDQAVWALYGWPRVARWIRFACSSSPMLW